MNENLTRDQLAISANSEDLRRFEFTYGELCEGYWGDKRVLSRQDARYAYADAMIEARGENKDSGTTKCTTPARTQIYYHMNHTLGISMISGYVVVQGCRGDIRIISPILSFEDAEEFAKKHLKDRKVGYFGFLPVSLVRVGE